MSDWTLQSYPSVNSRAYCVDQNPTPCCAFDVGVPMMSESQPLPTEISYHFKFSGQQEITGTLFFFCQCTTHTSIGQTVGSRAKNS